MKQEKMYIISKIFNNETIRTVWNSEEEKYYISIIDLIRILTRDDIESLLGEFVVTTNNKLLINMQIKNKLKIIDV